MRSRYCLPEGLKGYQDAVEEMNSSQRDEAAALGGINSISNPAQWETD